MQRLSRFRIFAALTAILSIVFVLAGCGGGGGSLGAAGLNVFLTDDFSDDFDQVWVTVYQVEITDGAGGNTSVFTSADGVVVDLANLSDGAARFLYVGTGPLAADEYIAMRVTLGRDLTLVPTGLTSGEACTFDPAFDFGADQTRISFMFGGPFAFPVDETIVIDFDLSQWTKNLTVVTPVLTEGSTTGLDDQSRHEEDDYHGTVVGLSGTASSLTFTLNRPEGGSFSVVTDTDTVVYNEDGSASPTLANGQRVEVTGTFSPVNERILAISIKIEDGDLGDDDDFEVEGTTQDFVEANLAFDVLIREAEGFVPTEGIVHVEISQSTRFSTKSGISMTLGEMVALLNGGPLEVEVEGTYDEPSNTITATKMKLHFQGGGEHEAEARGTASNIDTDLGTFVLALQEWSGFSSSQGSGINVTTDGFTTFEGPDGEDWTSTQFFAEVENGGIVKVHGEFLDGTIMADRVKLRSADGSGDNHDDAEGYATAWNEALGTVTIDLTEWFGFEGTFGAEVVIQATGSTVYRALNGDTITKAAFFAALTTGAVVDAEGTYLEGVLTADKIRLED
ncbi:MAG: DUF4382 domain-containing protein [Armatimonadetes bacterium]|nr:DUF4382 domain-containing protein [Armatimonadota bacterium]